MQSASRKLEKKRSEVALCQRVARAINELDGTDYYVADAERQPRDSEEQDVDIIFLSASGAWPSLAAQVTTIPYVMNRSDRELRDDNDSVAKIEQCVGKSLLERGVRGWQIEIDLTEAGELQGLRPPQLAELGELIQQAASAPDEWSLHGPEDGTFSGELAKYVSDVSGQRLSSGILLVHAGRGCFIPESRNFIEEAVRAKKRKYSCDTSCLMLVIGAASTILPMHIDLYRRECNVSEILFSEVWIVPAFDGQAIPLKRASTRGDLLITSEMYGLHGQGRHATVRRFWRTRVSAPHGHG